MKPHSAQAPGAAARVSQGISLPAPVTARMPVDAAAAGAPRLPHAARNADSPRCTDSPDGSGSAGHSGGPDTPDGSRGPGSACNCGAPGVLGISQDRDCPRAGLPGAFRQRLRALAAATAILFPPVFSAALAAMLAVTTSAQAATAYPSPADSSSASRAARPFQFGVVGHALRAAPEEALLRRAITEASQDKPAFIVATGIKAPVEPCSDRLYAQRREVLDESPRPLVVLPAGSDWSTCRNSAGRSNAVERLNRIRDVFYPDNNSLGTHKLALNRQSANVKFRSYAENTYWEHGNILFATVDLPADNNHYLAEAGRNSEYEDRLVANRAWLHRLFLMAQRRNLEGVVLFADGNIQAHVEEGFSLLSGFTAAKQDGFAPVRKQVRAFAEKYKGKVLLVDSQGDTKSPPAITWRGNIGRLGVGVEWETVRVVPGSASLFSLKDTEPNP